MITKEIKSAKVTGNEINTILSGEVVLWSREAIIKERLKAAAKDLRIQDGRGIWHGGEGLTEIYNVHSDFKTLPSSIEGYNVNVTYKSSNPYYLDKQGHVSPHSSGVKRVSLYATITDRTTGQYVIKEFLVYII